MISEQRIIELAKFHANEVYEDYAGFTFKQLQEFANALQAEWIKSLGEPAIITCESNSAYYPEMLDRLEAMPPATKLYALPNEEVK